MFQLAKDILSQVDEEKASERDRFLVRKLRSGRYFVDADGYRVLRTEEDYDVVRSYLYCIYDGVTEYSVVYKKGRGGESNEFIEFEGVFES